MAENDENMVGNAVEPQEKDDEEMENGVDELEGEEQISEEGEPETWIEFSSTARRWPTINLPTISWAKMRWFLGVVVPNILALLYSFLRVFGALFVVFLPPIDFTLFVFTWTHVMCTIVLAALIFDSLL